MDRVTPPGPAQHAAPARPSAWWLIGVIAAFLLVGVTSVATHAIAPPADVVAEPQPEPEAVVAALPDPPPFITPTPTPEPEGCEIPAVSDAAADADATATLAGFGGAVALREAVAADVAPCVDLTDPTSVWVVINKLRPIEPIDYHPAGLVRPDGVRNLIGGTLRADAAEAFSGLARAVRDAGAGEIALHSGYRSYSTQQSSYGNQVAARGQSGADLISARPGHSEHQSGLAVDVVACGSGCGSIHALGDTAQGRWIAENAWRHGFIVRYEAGHTDTTGYSPEPWHLRYIGVDLAAAYHEGGFHTLEDFWGLPDAPEYAG